jgi:hypothetical protein
MARSSGSRPIIPQSAQPVSSLLEKNDAFTPLRAGLAQATALQRDLRGLLPDYLAEQVVAASIRDGVLPVITAHNALATRLRHLEPGVVEELQRRGWPVRMLRIRVQPAAARPAPPPKQARMSGAGLDALSSLSASLPPSELQDALAKLIARYSRPPGGSRT